MEGGGIGEYFVNQFFVSRYILGEAGRREMLKDLPENRALEVGLSPYFCYFIWSLLSSGSGGSVGRGLEAVQCA